MNRRQLLGRLLGVSAVATLPAATATCAEPQRALTPVAPVCPKSGHYLELQRRHRFPGDLLEVECPYCGWKGVTLAFMPQTEWPK